MGPLTRLALEFVLATTVRANKVSNRAVVRKMRNFVVRPASRAVHLAAKPALGHNASALGGAVIPRSKRFIEHQIHYALPKQVIFKERPQPTPLHIKSLLVCFPWTHGWCNGWHYLIYLHDTLVVIHPGSGMICPHSKRILILLIPHQAKGIYVVLPCDDPTVRRKTRRSTWNTQ